MKRGEFLLLLGVFVIILAVASVLTFTTGNVVSDSRSCIDSDQTDPGYTRQSLLVEGSTTETISSNQTQTKIDSCLGRGFIKEAYCTTSAYVAVIMLRCPRGTSCTDGACAKRT